MVRDEQDSLEIELAKVMFDLVSGLVML